jgi:hypothetical protein
MRQLFQARRLCVKSIGKCSKNGKTVFQFYLHRADDIARLVAHPEIIAEWRAADVEAMD